MFRSRSADSCNRAANYPPDRPVFGEVVDESDAAYAQVAALDWRSISGEQADPAVYHYYPSPEQVRAWLDQAGLAIEEEGIGDGYTHLLARKNA